MGFRLVERKKRVFCFILLLLWWKCDICGWKTKETKWKRLKNFYYWRIIKIVYRKLIEQCFFCSWEFIMGLDITCCRSKTLSLFYERKLCPLFWWNVASPRYICKAQKIDFFSSRWVKKILKILWQIVQVCKRDERQLHFVSANGIAHEGAEMPRLTGLRGWIFFFRV